VNKFEARLKEDLERAHPGCLVLRNGWPDFAVVDAATGTLVKTVEGKDKGDIVRAHQNTLHKALRLAGLPTEVWYACGTGYVKKGEE